MIVGKLQGRCAGGQVRGDVIVPQFGPLLCWRDTEFEGGVDEDWTEVA